MRILNLATTIYATAVVAVAALVLVPNAVSAQSVDVSATIVSAIDVPAVPQLMLDNGEFRALQDARMKGGRVLTLASVKNSPSVAAADIVGAPNIAKGVTTRGSASAAAVPSMNAADTSKSAGVQRDRSITVTWTVASNS